MDGAKHRLEVLTVALDGLSPTTKLINGFGYIDKDNVPVTGIDMVGVGDEVGITIHDGTIKTKVIDVCSDNNS